jgi:hypothetical protein
MIHYTDCLQEKRRPIIFIAHSLGGLLVKEALIVAGRPVNQTSHIGSNENSELCNSCYSLIFFGVPNLGIRREQLVTLLKGKPNDALITSLVLDNDTEPSAYLNSLNKSFLESFLFDDSPVISYYERLSSKTVKVGVQMSRALGLLILHRSISWECSAGVVMKCFW